MHVPGFETRNAAAESMVVYAVVHCCSAGCQPVEDCLALRSVVGGELLICGSGLISAATATVALPNQVQARETSL
jgi:hypothetical protein